MRGSEGEEGDSIPGRAESPFKGPEVGKALVCWRNQYNAYRCSDTEPVAQRPSHFVQPTPLESGDSRCVPRSTPPAMLHSGLAVCWVCVSERKSEWITCQDWGWAGRMWSVYIFCLLLKFSSLQTQA